MKTIANKPFIKKPVFMAYSPLKLLFPIFMRTSFGKFFSLTPLIAKEGKQGWLLVVAWLRYDIFYLIICLYFPKTYSASPLMP